MVNLKKTTLVSTLVLAITLLTSTAAWSQGTDTVYDKAGVLSGSEEQQVQQAFDQTEKESGKPLYAFLVQDKGIDSEPARQNLLIRYARQANVPQDAGVIVVDPAGRWTEVSNVDGASAQAVSDAMKPDFQNGNFAAGLIAGAGEIRGDAAAPQGNAANNDAGSSVPGWPLLLLVVVAGVVLLLQNRRRNKRWLEDERQAAEGEFADLTTRIDEFDQKERLISGYLEAQRPLLDQRTEEWVEARISEARTTGFAKEFNGAAPLLDSDPASARQKIGTGRGRLEDALRKLDEAETIMDEYRAADEALDGKLRITAEELENTRKAEEIARFASVSVQPLNLRPEYDRLAKEAADRAAHRDEYDPRQALTAVDALIAQARQRQEALRDEVAARDALPEERYAAEGILHQARETLGEYRPAYDTAVSEWGPAALADAPAPGELSTSLRHGESSVERAGRSQSAGNFAKARSLLREAAGLARNVTQAPGKLRAAIVQADRKKREGEEKLKELEARLEQAKAYEHRMSPVQQQQLREYEYQLQNARYGFFGGDWLTALLLFEALDNNYMYMGDPSYMTDDGFGDGDFGGGDWGGGDFGGGDFGGGDFGGGGW